jgi:hypothetical protein
MANKTSKHRSHLKGRLGCKPWGKYKKKLQKQEEREWIKKEKEWNQIMGITK